MNCWVIRENTNNLFADTSVRNHVTFLFVNLTCSRVFLSNIHLLCYTGGTNKSKFFPLLKVNKSCYGHISTVVIIHPRFVFFYMPRIVNDIMLIEELLFRFFCFVFFLFFYGNFDSV